MSKQFAILAEGYYDPVSLKLAAGILRYRPEQVVAVINGEAAGRSCKEILGVDRDTPIVGTLEEAAGADTLLLGTAPPGGKIPDEWRPVILKAIQRGMDVVSGMHDFLCDDPSLVEAAAQAGVELIDLRKNEFNRVASGEALDPRCLRVHTIANSISCGKMTASLEIVRELQNRSVDSRFLATGQVGIAISGDGHPIDRVIADFVSGAAEDLVLSNQHHEVLLIEGQGSLIDMRYSGVTLGLLHGSRPDALIYCYQMGNTPFGYNGREEEAPSPRQMIDLYEMMANAVHPCRTIAVAVNGHGHSDEQVDEECRYIEGSLNLPACDVMRHGPEKLVNAIIAFQAERHQMTKHWHIGRSRKHNESLTPIE